MVKPALIEITNQAAFHFTLPHTLNSFLGKIVGLKIYEISTEPFNKRSEYLA